MFDDQKLAIEASLTDYRWYLNDMRCIVNKEHITFAT